MVLYTLCYTPSIRTAVIAVAALSLESASCSRREEIAPEPGLQSAPDATPDDAALVDRLAPDAELPGACSRASGLPGPKMVEVPSPDGIRYCIDSTEVTQGQYFEFLKAKGVDLAAKNSGDTSGQPPGCEWNSRFAPDLSESDPSCRGDGSHTEAFDWSGQHAETPVGCIDWCDAHMYCAWAGKRLCGKIGGDGLDAADVANATASQWYNACSQGGTTTYPYGNTFEAGRCVDQTFANEHKAPDGSTDALFPASVAPGCRGDTPPFDMVFNLSGDAWEWTDACRPSQPQGAVACFVVAPEAGQKDSDAYACRAGAFLSRDTRPYEYGFRCCFD